MYVFGVLQVTVFLEIYKNLIRHSRWSHLVHASAETVQAVNKQTLGGVSPWFGVPALIWICLWKALSGGKLCRTIREGVFPLATVAIYQNK